MNADEKEICEMLKESPDMYLSVREISKRLGRGRLFGQDRHWARPIVQRMELDGILESNPFGEYRLREKGGDTTSFFQAIQRPDISLGDTTLITLDDVTSTEENPPPDPRGP